MLFVNVQHWKRELVLYLLFRYDSFNKFLTPTKRKKIMVNVFFEAQLFVTFAVIAAAFVALVVKQEGN